MKTGIELISKMRWEQVYEHGYDKDHDSDHTGGELSKAAAALACIGTDAYVEDVVSFIEEDHTDEWGLCEKLKDNRVKALIVAGALIAAEIDRINKQ
jgi:hypothetical protein